ncbi:MAG: saccharopine dehydrogenase C-terminal domain-containing protein [Candidatus Nanoarchaeia archaeon]|nr:saccharopine dehydrogenase C-terminal domain-containing protein [Candidatus Nanoarchaeia archaeon]
MKYDFVIIGATGLQGRIVSRYLLEKGYKILLCGRKRNKVKKLLKHDHRTAFKYLELNDHKKIWKVLKEAKAPVVINCAEGDFNLIVQKLCLKVKAHYIDLGSSPEMTAEQFNLDRAFKRKNLCAITGCGSVPGIGNVMLRYACQKLDKVTEVNAGFAWSANKEVFVVPFSIMSIIEEFTDTPTVVKNGRLKKVPQRSDSQFVKFKGIGKQRVFLVRHSEAYTFYKYLKPKGIKSVKFYAGFPEFSYRAIMNFINTGLGSKTTNGNGARPIDLLVDALKSRHVPKGYHEKENLWVTIKGKKNNRNKIIKMNCLVHTIKGWEEHGCNIDTGLPCAIIAVMLKEGIITSIGARSPEFFVPVEPFFKALAKNKMNVYDNNKKIN